MREQIFFVREDNLDEINRFLLNGAQIKEVIPVARQYA